MTVSFSQKSKNSTDIRVNSPDLCWTYFAHQAFSENSAWMTACHVKTSTVWGREVKPKRCGSGDIFDAFVEQDAFADQI